MGLEGQDFPISQLEQTELGKGKKKPLQNS